MANLFPFPYADSTKTANGITYTVNSDKSINVSGTATADSQFYVVEASDPIELGPGYYTLQGTGDSDIQIALISVYTPGGSILYIQAGEDDAEFTLTETKEFHAQIGVPSGTTADLTVTPGLVKTGDLVTIDAENAKQIRQTMDVIIQVTPEQGEPIVINNSNLISCTVSLRSDLSIIEPTLPESEINIEAYFDDDISDVLASIPDETPVTYQAGYPGDMSPVRNFYLAEQITWQDNVMSIHAVDAVHKLDEDLPASIQVGASTDGTGFGLASTLSAIYRFFCFVLGSVGIIPEDFVTTIDRPLITGSGYRKTFIARRSSKREIIASLMNLFHVDDFPEGHFSGGQNEFWLTYVDAGIPTVTVEKPTIRRDIYEEDCGNIQKKVDREITGIDLTRYNLSEQSTGGRNLGTCTWIKESGVFQNFDSDFIYMYQVWHITSTSGSGMAGYVIPPMYDGTPTTNRFYPGEATYGDGSRGSCSRYLAGSDIPKGLIHRTGAYANEEWNSQVMPWNSEQETRWNTIYGSSRSEDAELTIYACAYSADVTKETYGSGGNKATAEDNLFIGIVQSRSTSSAGGATLQVYPQKSYNSLLSRSNITGSFTWKGDPRMQPRDVVTFHRLDGTTEDITIENITLSHEKGGLSAEITYRKGIC